MRKSLMAIRYSFIGVVFAALISVLQGCSEREGAFLTSILYLLGLTPEAVPEDPLGKIYFLAGDEIGRIALDGTDRESLVCEAGCSTNIPQFGRPSGLALDMINSKLYWIEGNVHAGDYEGIRRANLDGTEVENLLCTDAATFRCNTQSNNSLFGSPNKIALDISAGKMYFTGGFLGGIQIMRANTDGTNAEIIICGSGCPNTDPDGGPSTGIALDLTEGKLYYASRGFSKIKKANLDGSNIEEVVTGLTEVVESLALDIFTGKIHWAVDANVVGVTNGKLLRSDFNGNNLEQLICNLGVVGCNNNIDISNDSISAIALDLSSGRLYFDNGVSIQRSNLTGLQVETGFNVFGLVEDIAVAK